MKLHQNLSKEQNQKTIVHSKVFHNFPSDKDESDTLSSKRFVNDVCEPYRLLTGGGRGS